MAHHPQVFNELAVSMVRAGQEGGFLEDVLKRIADFAEHQEDLKAKVIGALAYPVFLAIAGFVVLNILVIFFVPKFEPIFEKLKEKGELPALTTYLMAFSHFLQSRVGLIAIALAIVRRSSYFVHWTRRGGRTWADRMKIQAAAVRPDLPEPGAVAVHPHPRHDAAQRHPDPEGAAHRQGLDRQPGAGRGHRAESPRTSPPGRSSPTRSASRATSRPTWSR